MLRELIVVRNNEVRRGKSFEGTLGEGRGVKFTVCRSRLKYVSHHPPSGAHRRLHVWTGGVRSPKHSNIFEPQ